MSKKLKETLYLETSAISAYFDFKKQDSERKKITRKFWNEILPKYNLVISDLVVAELSKTTNLKNKVKFLNKVKGVRRLKITTRVENLSKQYTNSRIIPKPKLEDAIHLALATINNIEYLVSWNYEHLVGAVQRKRILEFNEKFGLSIPIISTPNDFLET